MPKPVGVAAPVEPEDAVLPQEPWWVNHCMWMKGWEAFGVTGREPTVRQFYESDPGTKLRRMGTMPFGPGEVKMGVAGVHFSTHADDRNGGYLHVIGTTEEAVRKRWLSVDLALRSWIPAMWKTH
jgi:hypothetical protein